MSETAHKISESVASNTHEVLHDAVHHASAAMQHHEAAAHQAAGHAEHAAHELPNIITLLNEKFGHSAWAHFLHQWENITFSLLIAGIISFVFLAAARKKSIIPEGIQNFCEALVEAIDAFASGILGPHGTKHVPFLGTIFIYILLMNWAGLVPLMKSPTSVWSITLAIALVTMVYVQATGIKEQGLGHYLKHLAGNPSNVFGYVLIPLMLVLNIILEVGAVPFSLSLRLFANVSSEDRLLFNFAQLTVGSPFFVGILFQLFANILAIVFSIVQAFVFMLLSTVYLSLILPHEDHGHDEHAGEPVHAH